MRMVKHRPNITRQVTSWVGAQYRWCRRRRRRRRRWQRQRWWYYRCGLGGVGQNRTLKAIVILLLLLGQLRQTTRAHIQRQKRSHTRYKAKGNAHKSATHTQTHTRLETLFVPRCLGRKTRTLREEKPHTRTHTDVWPAETIDPFLRRSSQTSHLITPNQLLQSCGDMERK